MSVRPAAQRVPGPGADPDEGLVLVECLHAYQLNWVDEAHTIATVTYPVGADTVLSAQPDGTWVLVPREVDGLLNAGPYERVVVELDRVVFAPLGAQGTAWVAPYSDRIPNV